MIYVDPIIGSFTHDKLVQEAESVVMIGTATGLAPFISMVKQLSHDGSEPDSKDCMYTLLHTNGTSAELGYYETLLEIEASGSFDLLNIPTVSRPSSLDHEDPRIGTGRATNVLRLLFGFPMKEEEDVNGASRGSSERGAAEAALARTPRPALPSAIDRVTVENRFDAARAVILACGNPASTADIERTAARGGIRSEVEPW